MASRGLRFKREMRSLPLILIAATCCLSTSASSQSSHELKAAQDHISSRLVTLGTGGGPVPRVRRSAPANMIQVGDRVYLIDAGSGVAPALVAAGVQPGKVKTIFLTHLHYDHVGGLADLIAYDWLTRSSVPIAIYGPPATGRFVDAVLELLRTPLGIFAVQIPPTGAVAAAVNAHDLDTSGPKIVYQDDRVRVSAVENSHYVTIPADRRPAGAARSFAYRFDTPDRSFVFTGDTGPSAAVEQLAVGADVLVSEVLDPDALAALLTSLKSDPDQKASFIAHMEQEHLAPEAVGQLATRAGVKMVILSHIGPGEDSETDLRRYTVGVRKHYSGPVVAARDGDEF